MGARGPKPKGGYGDKTAVLSTRITAPVRAALDKASKDSGRSLSSEVEHRLRRSFDEDRTTIAHLGGPQLYAVLRTISGVMEMVGQSAFFFRNRNLGPTPAWLLDPYAYDQAFKAVVAVLEGLRPPGDSAPPALRGVDDDSNRVAENTSRAFGELGPGMARHFLSLIAEAEPTQPLPAERITKTEKLSRRVASDLGPIARHARTGDKS